MKTALLQNRRVPLVGMLFISACLIFACAGQPQSQTQAPAAAWVPDYFPTLSWRTSTPEEQGVESAKLADGLLSMRQKGLNIHSLLLVRNGSIILDAYFYPYDGTTVHELASVTKSVTTALIGIAADQGKLSLDAPMLSFFPDRTIANRDPSKERITVRHLASMSAGLDCTGENDEQTLGEMKASSDWVQFVLDRRVVSEPGSTFVYCSPGMHLLSAILQKATGQTELEFARKNVFEPLGIQEVLWDADPQGYNHGWADLFLYPRDLAKIGYLWANKGVWEGKQIVSRAWVENSVKLQMKTGGSDDYGYGWWLAGGNGEYAAIGDGGQRLEFYPAFNTILVMTGGGVQYDEVVDPFVAPAFADLTKPLPANPDGVAQLSAALKTIAWGPAPKALSPNPPLAQSISGKTYALKPNLFNLKSIRLDFDDSAEARLELAFTNNEKTRSGKVGLDGVYRFSPGESDLPSGMRGSWADANTFVLDYDLIAARDAYTLRMRFDGDQVVVEAKERSRSDSVTLEGQAQNLTY